jgi:hypothetical protein
MVERVMVRKSKEAHGNLQVRKGTLSPLNLVSDDGYHLNGITIDDLSTRGGDRVLFLTAIPHLIAITVTCF